MKKKSYALFLNQLDNTEPPHSENRIITRTLALNFLLDFEFYELLWSILRIKMNSGFDEYMNST